MQSSIVEHKVEFTHKKNIKALKCFCLEIVNLRISLKQFYLCKNKIKTNMNYDII